MKKKMAKHKFNIYILIYGLAIFILFGMTIGFAAYNKLIDITGSLTIPKMGKLVISNITLNSSSNVDTNNLPTWTENSIDFNTTFTNADSSQECIAVYEVTFTNNGSIEYSLSSFNFSSINLVSSVENDNAEIQTSISGTVTPGYVFSPGEVASAIVTISVINPTEGATYSLEGDATTSSEIEKTFSLEAGVLAPKTGDLTGSNVRAPFTLSVISTYENEVSFSISLSSSNYKVVDSSGNDLGLQTISPNSEDTFPFYIEIIDPTKVSTNHQTLGVIVSANGKSKVADYVELDVDEYQEFVDTEAPVISNLSFSQTTTYADRGKGTLTWTATDDSNITSYTIIKYEKLSTQSTYTETVIDNVTTNQYEFTNLVEDASYYFKVYGIDQYENTATQQEINEAGTSSGKCMATNSVKCEWVFNVTTNLTNISSNGASTVNIGQNYTCTLSANRNYKLPTSITVTMGGRTLTAGNGNNSQYTYNSSSGALTIRNVNGEINISGSATGGGGGICLIEGTKIRLYDGTYKNIEDIDYTDLLAVWSYDEGKIVPDYPIWIEKEQLVESYQLNEFDDGTILKTAGFHGVFDISSNMFISVDDENAFKVGTEIAKIDENGNIYSAKVKSIETVYETVNHYHIMSTKFFNIIANDFLTTDGTVILSNIFGFKENITWPETRYEIIKDENNLFKYEDFKDILPYYLFVGCRALEAKVICNYGYMTTDDFINYLYENVVNPNMHKEPIKNNKGNNLWMMTTSFDALNVNKSRYLFEEGSCYRLPKVKDKDGKKAYWYNAVTNKYYECDERIRVDYSMHFELIYK